MPALVRWGLCAAVVLSLAAPMLMELSAEIQEHGTAAPDGTKFGTLRQPRGGRYFLSSFVTASFGGGAGGGGTGGGGAGLGWDVRVTR